MAIFGKKDKKKEDKKAEKDNVLDMVAETEQKKQESKDEKKEAKKPAKTNTGDAYKVLTRPIVSEKSYSQVGMGKYAFRVNTNANKVSIRKAIEKVYDVNVVSVNIIRIPGKVKRSGRIEGRTSNIKKAIITLKKGQQIS